MILDKVMEERANMLRSTGVNVPVSALEQVLSIVVRDDVVCDHHAIIFILFP